MPEHYPFLYLGPFGSSPVWWLPKEEDLSPVAPDLSHFYERKVEAINDSPDGTWEIVLEGGIVIYNYDPTLPKPGPHIVGQRFTNMTLSPTVTSMFFGGLGGNTVSLNPMQFAIGTETTETPYYPQVSEAQGERWQPPPAPDERVAEGPDADWEG
jgi:hypothetical protein